MLRYLRSLGPLLVVLCLGLASANAETEVNWQRGLVIAKGAAVGDLRSPSRQLARVKAERQAKRRCKAILLESLSSIRRASGKKIGSQKQEALDGLAALIFPLTTDYGTDGSVVVQMALPLDALRAQLFAPDQPIAKESPGPAALIIDARSLSMSPGVGTVLGDGKTKYRGPTLFFRSEEEARADPRVGKEAILLSAKRKRGEVLVLEPNALAEELAARPLVAILWKGKS